MARARYPTPKSYLAEGKFGRVPKRSAPLIWHQPKNVTHLMGLRAAEIQHAFAIEVRKRVAIDGRTLQDAADDAVFARGRFVGLLTGRYHLSLRDAAMYEALYGPILIGLEVAYTVVEEETLRRNYPNAIAMAPMTNRFDPRGP